MKLRIDNLFAYVMEADDEERMWLDELLAFEDEQARFKRFAMKVPGRSDTRFHLYDQRFDRFPTGLVPVVKGRAKKDGIEVRVEDSRVRPNIPSIDELLQGADLSWLFDFQLKAVRRCLQMSRGIVWSPTGCLTGDTVVEVNRSGATVKMLLKDLVHRFNGGRVTWGKKQRPTFGKKEMCWDPEIPTRVRSRSEDGYIRLHELVAAVDSGIKTVYRVMTESGHSLKASTDHEFLTTHGWKRLSELTLSDELLVDVGRVPQPKKKKPWYKVISGLKYHPFAGRRGVQEGKGGWSVPLHRLVMEAKINNLDLDLFITLCRHGHGVLSFLNPKEFAVHHQDEDPQNNDPSNLVVKTHIEHQKDHGEENWRHVTAKTAPSRITSIEELGEEQTYDLTMAGEPRNFLANGITVHNSGKGEMIVALLKAVPIKWGVVINSKLLVDDIAKRTTDNTGETVGIIGEGAWDARERITVATFQTLDARIDKPEAREFLQGIEGLIVDEVHTLAAHSYNAVAMQTKNAYFRFGFSGTPLQRGDKRSPVSIGTTGPVIFRITAKELIERGIIAEPNIIMTPVMQKTTKAKHPAIYAEVITNSRLRNETIVDVCRRARKPALVFTQITAHGHNLTQMLNKAGIPAEFVWGEKNTPKRKAAIERLVFGDIDVIVCSVVFNTGIDIPEVQSLVLAAAGKSTIATLQRVGRGVRAFDKQRQVTKNVVDVYDFIDLGVKMMEKHTRYRIRAYGVEDYNVSVVNDPHGIAIKKLRMKAPAYETEDAA